MQRLGSSLLTRGFVWVCPHCSQQSVLVSAFLNLIWLNLHHVSPWIQPDFANNVSLDEQAGSEGPEGKALYRLLRE